MLRARIWRGGAPQLQQAGISQQRNSTRRAGSLLAGAHSTVQSRAFARLTAHPYRVPPPAPASNKPNYVRPVVFISLGALFWHMLTSDADTWDDVAAVVDADDEEKALFFAALEAKSKENREGREGRGKAGAT